MSDQNATPAEPAIETEYGNADPSTENRAGAGRGAELPFEPRPQDPPVEAGDPATD